MFVGSPSICGPCYIFVVLWKMPENDVAAFGATTLILSGQDHLYIINTVIQVVGCFTHKKPYNITHTAGSPVGRWTPVDPCGTSMPSMRSLWLGLLALMQPGLLTTHPLRHPAGQRPINGPSGAELEFVEVFMGGCME